MNTHQIIKNLSWVALNYHHSQSSSYVIHVIGMQVILITLEFH
jgi:hypothetical protein